MRLNITPRQTALIGMALLNQPASAVVTVPNGYTLDTYASVVNYSRVETMAMDPATRSIYYTGGGRSIYEINPATRTESSVGLFGVDNPFYTADMTFAGGVLYVSEFMTDGLHVDGSGISSVSLPGGFGYESGGAAVNGFLYVTGGNYGWGGPTDNTLIAKIDLGLMELNRALTTPLPAMTTLTTGFTSLASLEYNPADGYLYGVQLLRAEVPALPGEGGIVRIDTNTGAASVILPLPSTGPFHYDEGPGSGYGNFAIDPAGFCGPSSTGAGFSLYFGDGNTVKELAGFVPEPAVTSMILAGCLFLFRRRRDVLVSGRR